MARTEKGGYRGQHSPRKLTAKKSRSDRNFKPRLQSQSDSGSDSDPLSLRHPIPLFCLPASASAPFTACCIWLALRAWKKHRDKQNPLDAAIGEKLTPEGTATAGFSPKGNFTDEIVDGATVNVASASLGMPQLWIPHPPLAL